MHFNQTEEIYRKIRDATVRLGDSFWGKKEKKSYN